MIKYLKPKSRFSRNVLTLLTGTIVAQAIPIAITPILTRIYTPEEFGIYGFFMGVVLILSIIATARYEHAVFIVKTKRCEDFVVRFTLLNVIICSLILFVLIILLSDVIIEANSTMPKNVWYFVPIAVLIVSSYVVLRAWLNKQGKYNVIRSNLIKQSVTFSGLQILFGRVDVLHSVGLIFGDVLGKGLTTLLILKRLRYRKIKLTKKKYFYFWKKYKAIPCYQLPASLINTGAMYAPMLLLPIAFGPSISGSFFLVFKLVMAPISIIGNAFLDVYKVNAAEAIRYKGECKEEFKKIFKILLFLSIAIFFVFYCFAELLFEFVLGKEWREAGIIASHLALLAATRFLAAPLSYVVILRQRFGLNLFFQMALLMSVIGSIALGWQYRDFYVFLYFYSYLAVGFYCLQLLMSYMLASYK